MVDVSITFCVPCRFQQKAIQDADAILKEFGRRLASVRLVTGDDGVYDVAVDGRVIYSLDEEQRFPETNVLIARIRERLPDA
ncbi:MAG: hypothetical protein A3K59_11585 [Euryarchaeota archaeon RBG_19FT_COMBO_69_17]|nr:MAG: hypothetical protein A3K59_11585 [Euryarchaeota archaeon RBG_19FT_COMBO_69_17]